MFGKLKQQTVARLAVSACLLALLAACASGPDVKTGNSNNAPAPLSGELVYRQRIAMSPDAVVNLRLVDTDRGNTLAQQTIRPQGQQVPIDFALNYDPSAFVAENANKLFVTIHDGQGRLSWLAEVPVKDATQNDMQIVLTQAGIDNKELTGSQWQLLRIENADGSIDWARDKAPSTIVFGTNGKFNGKAACNGFFGSFQLQADGSMHVGNAGATLMACMGDNIATQFLQTLSKVDSYAMTPDQLRLQAGDAVIVLERDTQL